MPIWGNLNVNIAAGKVFAVSEQVQSFNFAAYDDQSFNSIRHFTDGICSL